MKHALALSLALAGAAACGDDSDAGPTGPTGPTGPGPTGSAVCHLVGDAVALPLARKFDLTATADGVSIVLGEAEGTASYTLDPITLALGPRVALGLARDGDLRLVADATTLYATTVFNARFEGLPIAHAPVSGESWTIDKSVEAAQERTFSYGSDLAASPTGLVAVVWLAATGLETSLLVATWDAQKAGTPEAYTFGTIDVGTLPLGVEVSAVFDSADRLQVLFTTSESDTTPAGLYSITRTAAGAGAGTWSAPKRLGDVTGSYQGQSVIASAATGSDVAAVAVTPADFASGGKGGVRRYLPDGTIIRGPSDGRPVVEGVDAATLADGRIVVSASWGENNLDPTASHDAVVLYVCDTATCSQALIVEGTRGTFYGPARITTHGQDGAIIFEAEPKGQDGGERTVLRRFSCDAATN